MVSCYDSKVIFQALAQARAREAKTDTQGAALRYGGDDIAPGERLRGKTIVTKRSFNSQPIERTYGKRSKRQKAGAKGLEHNLDGVFVA